LQIVNEGASTEWVEFEVARSIADFPVSFVLVLVTAEYVESVFEQVALVELQANAVNAIVEPSVFASGFETAKPVFVVVVVVVVVVAAAVGLDSSPYSS
jgi:hypothetical protein